MAPASTSSYQHKRGLQTALDGAAVVGNSYITWINTGTRYGSIT